MPQENLLHAVRRAGLVAHAARVIAEGSKSFAMASRLFDQATRERVWLLYAWCRRCDDLADDQDLGGALGAEAGSAARLETIRALTDLALAGAETGDPSFDCLGVVAAECGLSGDMADDVIAGFALDAADWRPRSEADLLQYCFHVAGAVGVMMAVVMGVSPQDDDTLDRACDLGLAFQLANIARDLDEDDAAGRCYLPEEWLAEAGIPPGEQMGPDYLPALVPIVRRMCAMEAAYEASARVGAARLPFRCRWAVLAASGIYGGIARAVERAGAHAWDHRLSTSTATKLGHVFRAFGQALVTPPTAPRPQWSRRELAARARGHAAS